MIFHCSGGAFISAVSAAVYLGTLSADRLPRDAELLELPYVAQALGMASSRRAHLTGGQLRGRLHVAGHDGYGNRVCVLGRSHHGALIQVVLTRSPGALGIGEGVRIVSECVGDPRLSPVHIGSFLCTMHLAEGLGRRLVCYGIRRRFADLCRGVERVRLQVEVSAPG